MTEELAEKKETAEAEEVKSTEETNPTEQDGESGFENKKDMGVMQEFFLFLWENKLWWMIPIGIVFALLVFMIAVGGSAAAPFIYPLF